MDYKRLKVWHLSHRFAVAVYTRTRGFPKTEIYGLTSQMRRAAVSVAANIVEGSARKGQREFLNFLYVALSSLAEARYYIELSTELGYLSDADSDELGELGAEAARALQGLITRIEKDLSS